MLRIVFYFAFILLTACAAIDSVRVFDDHQAKVLAESIVKNCAAASGEKSFLRKRHQFSVDGKTQQCSDCNNDRK